MAIGELGCCEEGIFAGAAKLQEPCMVSQSNVDAAENDYAWSSHASEVVSKLDDTIQTLGKRILANCGLWRVNGNLKCLQE
jgi:hypothetical protein